MKSKVLPMLMACFLCIALFYACKKTETQITPVSATDFKSVVQIWKGRFDSSANSKEKERVSAMVAKLDYSNVAKIQLSDNSVRYVIRIEKNYLTPLTRYLSVIEKQNSYSFEGVFLSHTIADIETVSMNKRLPTNSKVILEGLNGYMTKGWATTVTGEVRVGSGVSKNKYIEPTVSTFKKLMSGNNEYRTNNAPVAGGGEGSEICIYHYNIWYNDETGDILAIEYLGKDCTTTTGGGGDPAPQEPLPDESSVCSFTSEEADEINAATDGDNSVEIDGKILWIGHWPETETYERGATREIKFYTGSSPIESSKHPYFVTQYSGIEYKIGDYALFWKWRPGSVKYNGMVEKGSPIACNKFEFTINHAPILLNAEGTLANAKFTYTGKQKINCLLTVTVKSIDGSVDEWLSAQTEK